MHGAIGQLSQALAKRGIYRKASAMNMELLAMLHDI
jgi:hypothetical protein